LVSQPNPPGSFTKACVHEPFYFAYEAHKISPALFFKKKIKSFDIKIYHFSDLNQHQLYFFFLYQNVATSFFFILNKELKNNKNKFLYQNRIDKILRY